LLAFRVSTNVGMRLRLMNLENINSFLFFGTHFRFIKPWKRLFFTSFFKYPGFNDQLLNIFGAKFNFSTFGTPYIINKTAPFYITSFECLLN